MAGVRTARSTRSSEDALREATYEEIMGITSVGASAGGGAAALSARLAFFREWLSNEAKVIAHPSVSIVNGEATDGTKNAPVLVFGPPPGEELKPAAGAGRCGLIDTIADQALYDRTLGCQVRAAREIKKGEVMMTVPRSAMITPDLVAASDAGRAVLACCRPRESGLSAEFWDVFENTTICEQKFSGNRVGANGTQVLVKILQERKRAETAFNMTTAMAECGDSNRAAPSYEFASPGIISTRAPVLAFLIHQRFSNELNPLVVSQCDVGLDKDTTGSALSAARRLCPAPDTPKTFAPYARTLPSSVTVPLCWKRNELALLAGCIPGVGLLQEVAAQILQLTTEFIALLKAGITHRFPSLFPPGLLTWERWVWAAAVHGSRVLPVSCYLNKGDDDAVSHSRGSNSAIQSSPEVWNELGVMVPLLDMLNHSADVSDVTWEPCVPETVEVANGASKLSIEAVTEGEKEPSHPPRAVTNKRVKKGSEFYTSYGRKSNLDLILDYGFAQVGNDADELKIGWSLADAVGGVPTPNDYSPPNITSNLCKQENTACQKSAPSLKQGETVYDCQDLQPINDWWTDDRLSLLGREALVTEPKMSILKQGKRLTATAFGEGTYDPFLLSATVIACMPPSDVKRAVTNGTEAKKGKLTLTQAHQEILRRHLQFYFCRKMERMLENLYNGLKDHFDIAQLWTKASHGGLQYTNGKDTGGADGGSFQSWQSFFDSNVYATTTEVENRYYAIGTDSCVLALYDSQLRALRAAIDGLATWESFEKVLQQLRDLDFVILENDVEIEEDSIVNREAQAPSVETPTKTVQNGTPKSAGSDQKDKDNSKPGSKSRRRNRKKNGNGGAGGGGDRPPAIKLHIGNLAYTTQPADLFEHFADLYGRENILECHIPIERESGRSRGFGFVTMPDAVAMKVLQSGRKHEISGRLLKVAQSNSAGGRSGRSAPQIPSDRCATCGYRPRYCVCPAPDIPGHDPTYYYGDEPRASLDHPADMYYDHHGSRPSRDRRGSHSQSPSYHRGGLGNGERSREQDYSRDYDRKYRDYGSRSYSRSDRDSERGRRDRDRDRGRLRRRSRERSGGGSRSSDHRRSRGRDESRGWDGMSSRRCSSRSRSTGRSRSLSDERSARRERKGGEAGSPERSERSDRSVSPNASKGSTGAGLERKRESGKRSRSRSRGSRGKSGKRRKSSKKEGSRRRRSRSRSNSRAEKG